MSDPAQLRVWATLRRGISAWWDHLGLGVAASLSTIALLALASAAWRLITPKTGPILGIATGFALLAGAATGAAAGLAHTAHAIVYRDEVDASLLVRVPRSMLIQASALLCIQLMGNAAGMAGVYFYLQLRSLLAMAAGVIVFYMWMIWLICCAYHWPLLAAAHNNAIPSAKPNRPSLRAVFTNGLTLMIAAPGYSMLFGLSLMALNLPLILSGIGLAMAAPMLTAVLSAQAVRDHLVRLGMAEQYDERPVEPDVWRISPHREGAQDPM